MTGLTAHRSTDADGASDRVSMRGAGLLASLQVAMGMEEAAGGSRFAFLLLTHPPARRLGETARSIECELRDFGGRIGLTADTVGAVPHVGTPLTIVRGMVLLDVGGMFLRLGQPHSDWADHVADGGPALIMLGLEPLALHTAQAVDTYVSESALTQRSMVGLAYGCRTSPSVAAAGLRTIREHKEPPVIPTSIQHARSALSCGQVPALPPGWVS